MKDSKTSTTLADVTGDATFYAVFGGDPRVSATAVAFTDGGAKVSSDGGKVTGARHYAQGKKVTLNATANKGYAFAGWFDAASGELLSQAASLSFKMPAEDVDLYARFVTKEEDAGSIALAVDGVELSSEPASIPAYTNYCGVSVDWQVVPSALSLSPCRRGTTAAQCLMLTTP